MTARPDIAAMAKAEQIEFVELVTSLNADEWRAPSLCSGLSVRDVVVHIAAHIHGEPSNSQIARTYLRSGFSVARTELRLDRDQRSRFATRSNADLVDWLTQPMHHPESPTQLSELVIHQQDIRRAIPRPRSIPTVRLVTVLDYTTSRSGNRSVNFAYRRVRDLRLVATDEPWSSGSGPEVRGPAEAILMAVNGRDQALDELSGPGIELLTRRTERWSQQFT